MADEMDRKKLEAWLEDQPREVAVAISYRSALRALPFLSRGFENRPADRNPHDDSTIFLRSCLTSGVASICPTSDVKTAALAAATAAYAAAAAYADAAVDAYTAAVDASAADAAAYAADAAAVDDYDVYAVYAAAAAAYAYAADAVWETVGRDIVLIENGIAEDMVALMRHPIWPQLPLSEFVENSADFLAFLKAEPSLAFWARWFEKAVIGKPKNWDMQKDIALIDNDVWGLGAEAVAEAIAEIEAGYLAKALPLAEDIEVDENGKIYSVPHQTPAGDNYDDVLQSVQDAFEDALVGANNALCDDDLEAKILARALKKYRTKPYRIHQDFLIVKDNLSQKLEDEVFPGGHPPIVNLIKAVEDAAVNIRRAIPSVRETVAANAKVRLDDQSDEDRQTVIQAYELLVEDAREDFQEELREDSAEIETPQGEETTRAAIYRIYSRMSKVQKLVVGGFAGTTAIAGGIVTWEAAIQIILKIL